MKMIKDFIATDNKNMETVRNNKTKKIRLNIKRNKIKINN